MPQFIRAAGYKIYFWSNENDLSRIFSTMQIYYSEYIEFWKTYMGSVKYYKD